MVDKIQKTNDEWKNELNPDVYSVTRDGGTEAAFTGKYWNDHTKGMYKCSNCGLELFSSDTKFDSGTGWPSFDDPINREHIEFVEDTSYGMHRTEVRCARCSSHLGHVFDDGPKETTGKRFCLNSCSLELSPEEQADAQVLVDKANK